MIAAATAALVVLLLVLAVTPWFAPASGRRAVDDAAVDRPAGDRPAGDRPPGALPPGDLPPGDLPAIGLPAIDLPAGDRPAIDRAVLVDLAAAALDAGASVPGALIALGEAAGGAEGGALRRAGAALLLGASWSEAWGQAPGGIGELARALEPAWVDGVPAAPLLQGAADRIRADRSRQAQEAAARLGVRLVLPLGLCFLPAFVLLGLVPVLLSAGVGLLG